MGAETVLVRLVGADDSQPPLCEFFDKAEVPVDALCVKVAGGFIKHQQWGIGAEGERQFKPLLHAGGKVFDELVFTGVHRQQIDYRFAIHPCFVAFELEVEVDHFGEGELFNKFEIWCSEAELLKYFFNGYWLAIIFIS